MYLAQIIALKFMRAILGFIFRFQ